MTNIVETAAVALPWSDVKETLEHALGFSRDAIHVLSGPVIQMALAAIFRTSMKHPGPWIVVFALALANEWYDLSVEAWPSFAEQLGEGVKDILLTMLLPTLLLVVSRFAPSLLVGANTTTVRENESG